MMGGGREVLGDPKMGGTPKMSPRGKGGLMGGCRGPQNGGDPKNGPQVLGGGREDLGDPKMGGEPQEGQRDPKRGGTP